MEFSYYPGCSLESSAKEYQISAEMICKKLGIELVEIDNWNCCGALEVSSLNSTAALALSARNLKIASQKSDRLVVACNSCFNNLMNVQHKLSQSDDLRQQMNKMLGYEFREIKIEHLLDLIWNEVGLQKIGDAVERQLNGLKTVSYYGCLSVRPSKIIKSDDPDNPTRIDQIVSVLGGEPLEFTSKTKCCGGGVLMTYRDTSIKLTKEILAEASQRGAQCIIVTCPLCHMTLETLSNKVKANGRKIPVLFFTQLIGLSFGIEPGKLGLNRNLISSKAVVDSVAKH